MTEATALPSTAPQPSALHLAAAALMVLLAGQFVERILPGPGPILLFLPASGLALALVQIGGAKCLPAIFVGMLVSSLLTGQPLVQALLQAAGLVAMAGFVGYRLQRHPDFHLNQPSLNVLPQFLFWGCLVGGGIAALFWLCAGLLSGAWAGGHAMPMFWQAWMGHALGLLLVAVWVLSCRLALQTRQAPARWTEGALVWLLSIAFSLFIFGRDSSEFAHTPLANAYWIFLFIGWSSLRLGLLSTSSLLCLVALLALRGTLLQQGYFSRDLADANGFGYGSYMTILGTMALALSVYVHEHRRQQTGLRIAATAFETQKGLLITEASGRILRANAAARQMTGAPLQELVGRRPHFLYLRGGGAVDPAWFTPGDYRQGPLQVVHADASVTAVWAIVSPVWDEHGAIGHYVISLVDVSDFEAEQQRLRKAECAQRDALVREVHHRIKNNLQGIVGMLRALVHEHPQLGDAIGQVAAQVQSIAIVHGLQGKDAREQVCLAQLLLAIAHGLKQTRNADIEISADAASARLQLAAAEAVAVALVLHELMTNAIKHSPPGQDTVRVALAGDANGADITITNRGDWPTAGADTAAPPGQGLDLVRLLLPREGAVLTHNTHGGWVFARLALSAPVVYITND
ncbi:MASE1 domain-containing protein [Comamonas flocculans]|uniref:histidine kinase n=1 Tax=Comamonas flocculans TaxID=2597701 RepID=A0A5B8RWK7_9BURK|nr:MASE1 domain-containing protein [Comamonas flocculans]QEA13094.1 PAS domain-containing protein [Comamonas flocculans]